VAPPCPLLQTTLLQTNTTHSARQRETHDNDNANADDAHGDAKVPKDLPAGDYVLGWRYDCEGTAQVWSNW
jgi:hypothetical protein